MKRTYKNGDLRKEHIDQKVSLLGWVHRRRDHGGLIFIDLRDRSGLVQIVFKGEDTELLNDAERLRSEFVISVYGIVVPRSLDAINKNLKTGEIEVVVEKLEILNSSKTPPFEVADSTTEPDEMVRLKYRYIDLRKDKMRENLIFRHKIIKAMADYLDEKDFLEIETPFLTKSTPEGARDFLVPSRLNPGKFYALPQSPQQFKQLLMLSGFDRYFQIASCFRDEDARADRSPGEHTQLDIEMSFVTQEDVHAVIESVLHCVFTKFTDWSVDSIPFRKFTYADAQVRFGSDKPDLRIPFEIVDLTEVFKNSEFKAFRSIVEKGGVVRGIPVKKIADKPRSFFDKLVEYAQSIGSKGLAYLVWEDGQIKGPIAKFLKDE